MEYFISHASEDKQDFVRDLANQFIRNGATVFYDEYSIKLGDSLFDKINSGIKESKNCILVLSKYFFEKDWTVTELRAIFNQHVTGKIKLFVIYHNISFEEVSEEYPLLADILGINSEIGFEKIAEKIFEATDYKPIVSYGKVNLNEGPKSNTKKEGFHFMIRFALPRRGNPRIPKVLLDTGIQNQFHSRARLAIMDNERLYFEIVTTDYQKLSVSIDISNWNIGEPHVVIANLDNNGKTIKMYLDGKVKSELKYKFLNIPADLFNSGHGMIGCSLELDYPCPFIISSQSFGKSLNKEQVEDLFYAIDKYNKDLGR
jgi:hypothetical protein